MKTKKIISAVALSMIIAMLNITPVLAVEGTTDNTQTTNTTQSTQTTETTNATQPSAANISKKIIKEYSFTTETKPFKYDAPKTVTENGYEYEYKDISYKEKSVTKPVTTSKSYTGLTSRSVPNSISYNGKTLYLKETPTYTSHTVPAKKSTKTLTSTKTYSNVVPGTESNVIKSSVKQDGVTLKKSSQSYTTSSSSYTDISSLASYDHDLNVSGTNIQLTDSTPRQGDWQNDLHYCFDLPSSTTITDAEWASDIQHQSGSEKYTRSVRYTGERTLYNYTVRYSGTTTVVVSPEKTTYSATATYESKDKTKYTVAATATYEMTADSVAKLEQKQQEEQEQMNNNEGNDDSNVDEEKEKAEEEAKKAEEERLKMIEQQEKERKRNILIGCGIGLLALAGLLTAIYLIGRKKKEEDENDINQIMTKASSIKDSKNTAKKESEKERAAQQKREQAQKEKEERAKKAAEEKEKRRLEKQKAMEQKKQENIKRQESAEKSDFMKKLDQIKHDIATDDDINK